MAITPQQAAAKNKNWVDPSHPQYGTAGFVGAEDEDDYVAPAPAKVAGPNLGPMAAGPDGTATHDPAQPITPAAPAAAAPPAAVAPPAAAPAAPDAPPATVNDAFKRSLMDALNKPIGVDPSDPVIKGQTDAFSLAQTRAKQRDREAMASRAGATGQISDMAGSGAFDQGLSNLEQQQGEAEAGFNANLMGAELQNQRDELARYMAMAGNTLNAEEGRALQERLATMDADLRKSALAQSGSQFDRSFGMEGQKLAEMTRQFDASQGEQGRQFDMDAELKRLGIDTQGALGRSDLDLRKMLGEGGLNLNLLELLMGNEQFQQGEAGQNSRFGAGLDADLWRTLLGGLS